MRISEIADLADLAGRLQLFRNGISVSPEWHAQPTMAEVLGVVRRRHKHQLSSTNSARILELARNYLHTGQMLRSEDIFTLCLGAGWLDREGKGILADRKLRRKLLRLAETTTGRRRRLKAFRSLLYAYWSFPLHDDATTRKAIQGWRELRDWLKVRHAEIRRLPIRKPMWFNVLTQHLHLLEENPCDRYAKSLLRGNLDELQYAIDCLFIPAGSWIQTEAVMAQITEACQWQDEAFRAVLPELLKVATGDAGIRVTDGVTRRAIAKLVMRYAWQKQHEPHEDLFMLAIGKIGNPWWQQSAWDVHVGDDAGNPCALSREMVNAWLKDRLIGEFFLDSGQEESRSELWLKYSVFMQAISVAAPWLNNKSQALLVRMGEFLVIVPHSRNTMIETYSWQEFYSKGGARLLDKDTVDAIRIQTVLDKCAPLIRMRQTKHIQCDMMLRGLLFSSVAQ